MFSYLARVLCATAICFLTPITLAAQAGWIEPMCRIGAGHSLVRGGLMHLIRAAETPHEEERESRLQHANRVLIQAITEREQDENPAAWYYLGRYYVIQGDGWGADSAFRRAVDLKPECEDDVRTYRTDIHRQMLGTAHTNWGDGNLDSAESYFRLAIVVDPDDPRGLLDFGMMLSQSQELDSAAKYVYAGIEAAGDDTVYASGIKRGLSALVGGYQQMAYQGGELLQLPQLRQRRDSIAQSIDADSTHLAEIVGRVEEIRARGQHLNEESRRAFERESTVTTTRLIASRTMRDSLSRAVAAKGQAAAAAAGPAIEALRAYVNRYPQETDAATNLARMLSALGYRRALDSLVSRIIEAEGVSGLQLAQIGIGLLNDGQHRSAVRMLDAGLTRTPNMLIPLLTLARAYYFLREAEPLTRTAKRLLDIDPLSSNSLRMMAAAWDLQGNSDSVSKYVQLADGGIQWNVSVSQFRPTEQSTVVNGRVRNTVNQTLAPITLLFDFLGSGGEVLFSEAVEVPELPPGGSHSISIRLQQGGAVAWRYRKQ
ncbi:MAG: hypothetical protein O7D29_07175 [Gemmatimonadetes bacterium]|nr:hypothetical protein [Gemmatimonadota bacterium]